MNSHFLSAGKQEILRLLITLLFVGLVAVLVAGCAEDEKQGSDKQTHNTPARTNSESVSSGAERTQSGEKITNTSQAHYSQTTLLAAYNEGFASIGRALAGLEIRLQPGWKTYWRSPGNSGVPARLDWSKSQNIAKLEIKWPAPKRFKDVDGQSIGYKGDVILPLVITPKEASKDILLDASLFYGVCRDICVPVEARMQQHIKADDSMENTAVSEALEQVPQVWEQQDFALKSLQFVKNDQGKSVLRILARYPVNDGNKDMFVERADGEYMPLTKQVTSSGALDERAYDILLDEDTTQASLSGQKVIITMVSGKKAAEMTRKLMP